jgi:hypothetical protein
LDIAEDAELESEVLADEAAADDTSLRDRVSRDVERAVMRDVVVRFSSCQCLVKVREVHSSTPRSRYVSDRPMEGIGEGRELIVMNCV